MRRNRTQKEYICTADIIPKCDNVASRNVTLSIDEELCDKYREFCKKKGLLIYRRFEILMEEQLQQIKNGGKT